MTHADINDFAELMRRINESIMNVTWDLSNGKEKDIYDPYIKQLILDARNISNQLQDVIEVEAEQLHLEWNSDREGYY